MNYSFTQIWQMWNNYSKIFKILNDITLKYFYTYMKILDYIILVEKCSAAKQLLQ